MSIISYWVIIKEHDNANRVAFERCYATKQAAEAMQAELESVGITSSVTKDTLEIQ